MKINGYFNESCKICRTEINHYKKINNTIHWVDVISDKNALIDTKLSKKDLIRRLHIIKNNRVFKGLDAFLIVWVKFLDIKYWLNLHQFQAYIT